MSGLVLYQSLYTSSLSGIVFRAGTSLQHISPSPAQAPIVVGCVFSDVWGWVHQHGVRLPVGPSRCCAKRRKKKISAIRRRKPEVDVDIC